MWFAKRIMKITQPEPSLCLFDLHRLHGDSANRKSLRNRIRLQRAREQGTGRRICGSPRRCSIRVQRGAELSWSPLRHICTVLEPRICKPAPTRPEVAGVAPVHGGCADGGDGGVDVRPEHGQLAVGAAWRTQQRRSPVVQQVGGAGPAVHREQLWWTHSSTAITEGTATWAGTEPRCAPAGPHGQDPSLITVRDFKTAPESQQWHYFICIFSTFSLQELKQLSLWKKNNVTLQSV